jgi:hypothetical protein
MQEVLIINTEYFLQCHGNCSGCFLTEAERQSGNVHYHEVKSGLEKIAQKNTQAINHLVIGFGRGNLLNLEKENLEKLLELMAWCENHFNYQKLTFEVSSSLIGKLDKQIENAVFLLNRNRHIFFNIVINSEITSPSFWSNLHTFHQTTAKHRQSWGWTEDWGDILVLNVNPARLPNLEFIAKFTQDYPSPVNISIFPYEEQHQEIDMNQVNQWSEMMWEKLHRKDLNIKNYMSRLKQIDLNLDFNDLHAYNQQTEKSYYFVDKNGVISHGTASIMGEVDYLRLKDKYHLQHNFKDAYKKMQKNRACSMCEYQKECLVSGAFLNFLANSPKMKNHQHCASGYQKLFHLANQTELLEQEHN